MSEKFCKDCKHHGFTLDGYYLHGYCTYEPPIDLVTGEKHYVRCEQRRQSSGVCGREGRFFEPRPEIPPQAEEPKKKRPSVFQFFRLTR